MSPFVTSFFLISSLLQRRQTSLVYTRFFRFNFIVCLLLFFYLFCLFVSCHFIIKVKPRPLPPGKLAPHFVRLHFITGAGKGNFQNATSKPEHLLLFEAAYRSRLYSRVHSWDAHLPAPTHLKHRRSALAAAALELHCVTSTLLLFIYATLRFSLAAANLLFHESAERRGNLFFFSSISLLFASCTVWSLYE